MDQCCERYSFSSPWRNLNILCGEGIWFGYEFPWHFCLFPNKVFVFPLLILMRNKILELKINKTSESPETLDFSIFSPWNHFMLNNLLSKDIFSLLPTLHGHRPHPTPITLRIPFYCFGSSIAERLDYSLWFPCIKCHAPLFLFFLSLRILSLFFFFCQHDRTTSCSYYFCV